LTFANCEDNSNSLVFEISKTIPTLALFIVKAIQIHWFPKLEKQSKN
jgi:hypothetical protein